MSFQRSTISKGAIDASQLTRQREARVRFADIRVQKERFEAGCASRINTESGGQQDYMSEVLIRQGAIFTTPAELATILDAGACEESTPEPVIPDISSNVGPFTTGYFLIPYTGQFVLATPTGLKVTNDADLRMGTGDFTIEWYQNVNTFTQFPRVFTIGKYNVGTGVSIGVSIEGNGSQFYIWNNATPRAMGNFSADMLNKWAHFAIVRESGTTNLYLNGKYKSSFADTVNYNNTTDTLWIGNESGNNFSNLAVFDGKIAQFHWVKGTAKYTADFVPETITPIANTKLLLLATSSGDLLIDSSSAPKTVTQNGFGPAAVTWGSDTIDYPV